MAQRLWGNKTHFLLVSCHGKTEFSLQMPEKKQLKLDYKRWDFQNLNPTLSTQRRSITKQYFWNEQLNGSRRGPLDAGVNSIRWTANDDDCEHETNFWLNRNAQRYNFRWNMKGRISYFPQDRVGGSIKWEYKPQYWHSTLSWSQHTVTPPDLSPWVLEILFWNIIISHVEKVTSFWTFPESWQTLSILPLR